MQAMFSKVALTGLTLALGALAPAEAGAVQPNCYWTTDVVLSSGNTSTEVSRDNGVTWSPASVVTPEPNYSVIPGTSYINYNPTTEGVLQSWATYRASFSVPGSTPSRRVFNTLLTLQVHADNVAYAYLNGYTFFQHPFVEDVSHFQGAPETAMDYPFEGMINELKFDIFNFGGPTALDYKVTLEQYVCTPCTDPRQLDCSTEPL